MKIPSYLYEIPVVFVFLLVLNYFRFPEHPGFIEINPHPYWLAILLFGFRYGTYAGATVGIMSAALYLGYIWVFGDKYLFGDFSFYILPSLFIIAGALIGIGVDRYLQQIKKQKKDLIKLSEDKIHLYQELKTQRVINSELEKKIVTKMSTLVTLYEGGRRLDTTDFEDLYKSILSFVAKTLDLKEAAIYLKKQDKWVLKQAHGWPKPNAWPIAYDIHDGLVGLSGTSGKIVSIKDFLSKDAETQKIQVAENVPQVNIQKECLMAGPLKKGEMGEVLGVFSIQNMPLLSLNSATVNLFSFLLSWAGRSLGTAYYHEELRAQEILDPEFQIYSFRYFETRCKQEFLRSRTYYLPLSVALIMVSGTDEFPPQKKKSVFTAISRLLKNSCREIDVIASYHEGIPFVCLLTTTTKEKAQEIKDVILKNFSKLSFDKGIALKIGLSSFTPKVDSVAEFLEIAKRDLQEQDVIKIKNVSA